MTVLTSIIQKNRTWRKFSFYERYLLLQALILLPLIHLSLNILGFKRTYSILGNGEWGMGNGENLISSQILTTASMVKIAARYYKWATCLRKSLALWFLLRRQRIATELRIGTRFEKEFQAHAWVEYQGYVVGDRQMVKDYFVSFENLNSNLPSNLSDRVSKYVPEIEILLCCNNIHTDTAKPQRMKSLLQKDLDWNYFLKQACGQGVFLLLYQNLVKYYPQNIPKNIQPQLQAYCQIKTARNLLLSKKLCQLLQIFEKKNIKVIPFKGAALAASVYQSLILKEFCDIDLIIEQEDFSKVKELLTSQGYQPRNRLQLWGQVFTNKDDTVHIDLHWQLAPSCFPYRVDFEQLWQRCETVSILEHQVTNLASEDLLLILCLQMVKDAHYRQEKLKQVYDIAQLINNCKLDWEIVIQRARDLGSERLLVFGLGIVNELLEVEMPAELQQKIERDLIVKLYLTQIVKQLFAQSNKQRNVFGIFERGLIQGLYGFVLRALMLLDNSQLIARHNRYLLGHLISYILKPNSKDLEYVCLPRFMYILYYLVRPIRLSLKFLKSVPSQKLETNN